ncbi:MAG: PTS sugar transporter subunit IIA [Spirochaetales bacterium]
MVRISELLLPSCIKMELDATKKKEVLLELLNLLKAQGLLLPEQVDPVWKELLEREKASSTGIGSGIAIPHKILHGFTKTVMAFGRKRKGIPFDSIDGQPVNLIFLLLGQEGSESFHLRLLSKLARLLQQPSFREALLQADNPEQILSILKKGEEE